MPSKRPLKGCFFIIIVTLTQSRDNYVNFAGNYYSESVGTVGVDKKMGVAKLIGLNHLLLYLYLAKGGENLKLRRSYIKTLTITG